MFGLEKIVQFFRTDSADRSALARAWCVLACARTLLWVLPFERVLSLVRTRTHDLYSPPDWIVAGRLSWAVRIAARYIPVASCLSQAIALQVLLNREGIGAELKIGVIKDGTGEFSAHAWIESHGRVLIGSVPNLVSYRVMPL